MFSIGDKVVHPTHGAGIISALISQDFIDDDDRYYVIQLAGQERTLMVPVRSAESVGLRRVVSADEVAAILDVLASPPVELPNDFKQRQAILLDRLKDGDYLTVAEVVRDMAARSLEKSYSPTETRLYDRARSMLTSEIALAQDVSILDAEQQIARLTNGQHY
jgi:CarD family transcriptional regulator